MHRRAALAAVALGLTLAPGAFAMPVEVAFAGAVESSSGPVPGAGTAFTGRLAFDPALASAGLDSNYVLSAGGGALSLTLAGSSYATDPTLGTLRLALEWGWVNDDGERWPLSTTPPDLVEWQEANFFTGSGDPIVPVGGREYTLDFLRFERLPPGLFGPFDPADQPLPLPDAATTAEWLAGARFAVAFPGSSDGFAGHIGSATPVPEPGSALLLLAGLAALAARTRTP